MTYYTNAICSYIKLVLQSVFITVRFFRIDYNSLASMNVKSPLSSSEYISKPCFCISSLRLDNLPFSDFVVSAIINIPFREKEICRTAICDVAAVAGWRRYRRLNASQDTTAVRACFYYLLVFVISIIYFIYYITVKVIWRY
jgi:hypothetical protein